MDYESVEIEYETEYDTLIGVVHRAGYDLDNWVVEKSNLSLKENKVTAKIELRPSRILPARIDGVTYDSMSLLNQSNSTKPKMWVVLSDTQCPYHDEKLHYLVCRFLNTHRPDGVIANGDIFDFPTLSSYLPNPYMDTHVNQSIQGGYNVLRDWREAAGDSCKYFMLPGNHEQRLQKYVMKNSGSFIGMSRANEKTPVLAVPYLARLDELGYEFVVGKTGEWPQAQMSVLNDLTVTHGWLTRKGAGNTARASVDQLGRSVIVGHTHRAALVPITRNGKTLWGVENGTLCDVVGGLGYAVEPDWQQAFSVIQIWKDDSFSIDLVKYVNGKLIYGKDILQ